MSNGVFGTNSHQTERAVNLKNILVTGLFVAGVLGLMAPAWANREPVDQSTKPSNTDHVDGQTMRSDNQVRLEAANNTDEAAGHHNRTTVDIQTNSSADVQINGEEIDIPADGQINETIDNESGQTSLSLDINSQTTDGQDGELDVRVRQHSELDYEVETEVKRR